MSSHAPRFWFFSKHHNKETRSSGNIRFSMYTRSLCSNCRMSLFLSSFWSDVLRVIVPLKLTASTLSFQWPFARWNRLHLINEEARSLIYHGLYSAFGFMPDPEIRRWWGSIWNYECKVKEGIFFYLTLRKFFFFLILTFISSDMPLRCTSI